MEKEWQKMGDIGRTETFQGMRGILFCKDLSRSGGGARKGFKQDDLMLGRWAGLHIVSYLGNWHKHVAGF